MSEWFFLNPDYRVLRSLLHEPDTGVCEFNTSISRDLFYVRRQACKIVPSKGLCELLVSCKIAVCSLAALGAPYTAPEQSSAKYPAVHVFSFPPTREVLSHAHHQKPVCNLPFEPKSWRGTAIA